MKHHAPAEVVHPPIAHHFPDDLIVAPNSPATQRSYQRGELVRLGPGVYMSVEKWLGLDRAGLFLVVAAAKVLRCTEVVFGAETALFLAGLPVAMVPSGIVVVTRDQSRLGPEPCTVHFSPAAPVEAEEKLRYVPKIVRRRVDQLDPVRTGGFLTVEPPAAVADVCVRLPFRQGLTAADGLARFGHFIDANVEQAHGSVDLFRAKAHVGRGHRVLDLARPGAASVLETGSRSVMLQHGFQEPVLQHPHFDEHGNFIGFSDNHWEDVASSGEADGRIKYLDPRYRSGRSLEQVLMDEKIRQKRIEATGVRVIRWMWEDMINPEQLVRILIAAGIPQDPAWRVRLI